MDDLYREIIIEHYKNPGYRGHLDPHDIRFEDSNPLCGDHIEITLRTKAEAMRTCEPPVDSTDGARRRVVWRDDEALLKWLESL